MPGTTPTSHHPDAGVARPVVAVALLPCTVAGEPIQAICIQARPTVWATGQGRLRGPPRIHASEDGGSRRHQLESGQASDQRLHRVLKSVNGRTVYSRVSSW